MTNWITFYKKKKELYEPRNRYKRTRNEIHVNERDFIIKRNIISCTKMIQKRNTYNIYHRYINIFGKYERNMKLEKWCGRNIKATNIKKNQNKWTLFQQRSNQNIFISSIQIISYLKCPLKIHNKNLSLPPTYL